MDTSHPFILEVTAAELPESIVARLPNRPAADARLVLGIAPAESEDEKFLAIKKGIEEGIADGKAGRTYSADEVLAWLKQEIIPT